jgi:deazaflavin-dependent oxidoreductase (nitroreductase family)
MTLPADQQAYNEKLVEEFRAGGRSLGDRPLLLLTTTGARTGRPRTTPLMYVRAEGRLLVVASNAGAPKHPDWYHNLTADPRITVELAGETWHGTATPLYGDDHDRTWASIVAGHAFFADHRAKAGRRIPVVALARD